MIDIGTFSPTLKITRDLGQDTWAYLYQIDTEAFEVWETPLYGGKERYSGSFTNYKDAVDYMNSLM